MRKPHQATPKDRSRPPRMTDVKFKENVMFEAFF